ncbi:MAG: DUF1501 domain-containing protein [Planctomycetota bacterium]
MQSMNFDRRDFLRLSLGSALGFGVSGLLPGAGLFGGARRALAGDAAAKVPGFGVAEHCVILWLNGGPSQMETFDPKPDHKNGGPTKGINTKAKGVILPHTMPRLAEQMDKVCLVRSMATNEGNHQRARYFLHTGYVPSGTVRHPDIGALICQQKAAEEAELPPYVCVNGTAAPGAGALGVALAPFTLGDPNKPVENLAYGDGVDEARFARRRALLQDLDAGFKAKRQGSAEAESLQKVVAKADRMMHSPKAVAFDLSKEPESARQLYGESKFGQGCLMARRLIEQGTRVIEVQLNGWDTHKDNFTKTAELGGQLDQGFAALLQDLTQRDLLKKTLIVCMGEFGRTPRINPNEGRDHFAKAWSLALAGGPIRGGHVIGATSPDGMQVVERPLNAQDLMASVAHAMGLDASYVNYTKGGRPIQVVDEKKGKLVPELFQA